MVTSIKSKTEAPWHGKSADEWLRHVLAIHFHPETGTPYWLEKALEKGISVDKDIQSIDDLVRFGPMDEQAMVSRPVTDFIPRSFLSEKKHFILGDTAGTTGTPKTTVYHRDEFYFAFVEYFGRVADALGFPKQLNWLWIGPGGPHIIGKAARMLAGRMGSPDPFAVDFDARWIKKMMPGSMGWERYFQHVEDQAMHIINTQDIGVLFTTPPVLKRLAEKMSAKQRENIRGVHYGGMALSPELYLKLREQYFPRAVHISGYGNTLFGVCLEVETHPDGGLCYFPQGARLNIRIVPTCDEKNKNTKMPGQTVDYDERGQVVFSRLDECCLILNMFERDKATRIPPSKAALELDFLNDGLADPGPAPGFLQKGNVIPGLY